MRKLFIIFIILFFAAPVMAAQNLDGFNQRNRVISLRDHFVLYGDNSVNLPLREFWYTAEGTNDNFTDILYRATGTVSTTRIDSDTAIVLYEHTHNLYAYSGRPDYVAASDGVMSIAFEAGEVTPLDKRDGWYEGGFNNPLTMPRKISTVFILAEGFKGANLGFEFDYSGISGFDLTSASHPRILWELSVWDEEAGLDVATSTAAYFNRQIKGGVASAKLVNTTIETLADTTHGKPYPFDHNLHGIPTAATRTRVTLLSATSEISTRFIKGVGPGETLRLDVWANTPINIRAIRYYKHKDYSDRSL